MYGYLAYGYLAIAAWTAVVCLVVSWFERSERPTWRGAVQDALKSVAMGVCWPAIAVWSVIAVAGNRPPYGCCHAIEFDGTSDYIEVSASDIEVLQYDRALTAEEIRQLHLDGSGYINVAADRMWCPPVAIYGFALTAEEIRQLYLDGLNDTRSA